MMFLMFSGAVLFLFTVSELECTEGCSCTSLVEVEALVLFQSYLQSFNKFFLLFDELFFFTKKFIIALIVQFDLVHNENALQDYMFMCH